MFIVGEENFAKGEPEFVAFINFAAPVSMDYAIRLFFVGEKNFSTANQMKIYKIKSEKNRKKRTFEAGKNEKKIK